jgi:peptide-methionine (S)-S-oxide reductase
MHPYIVINDKPKVEQLKALFPDVYSPTPMTVANAKSAGH